MKDFLYFFPTPKLLTMPAVGIDISDSSIKFLELVDSEHGKGIGRYGDAEIPPGVVERGEIKNVDILSGILKRLKEKHDLDFIRASLPEEKVYLFTTKIPSIEAKESEIRNLIEFRLEENVPLSPAEAVFDFDLPLGNEGAREREVGVAVYPRTTIEQYSELFEKAGLTPLSFEVEAQAIARSVIREGDDGTYMIIDFGRMRTGLAIVSRGLLSFTSTLDVVGETLTNAIAENFGVSTEEAERIKNESDFIKSKDNSELFVTLMKTISGLKGEVERHYRYWNARSDNRGRRLPPIEKIILCGGSSNVVGLREYLSGSLKIGAERANIWTNAFSFDDVIPDIDFAHSLGYATAVGLALRSGF